MSRRVGGTSERDTIGPCRRQGLGSVVSLTSSLSVAVEESYYGSHKSSLQLGLGKGIE